jgi:hypothetical protein
LTIKRSVLQGLTHNRAEGEAVINRPENHQNTKTKSLNLSIQSGAIQASVALVKHRRTPLSNAQTKQDQGQPRKLSDIHCVALRESRKSR